MTARETVCEITLDGVDVLGLAIDRLRLDWGRSELSEQPDVSSLDLTIDLTLAGWTADTLPFDIGAEMVVAADHPDYVPVVDDAERTVYRGRVTDMNVSLDDQTGHPMLKLTTDDMTTQLAQIKVGDEPWPEETAEARAERIMGLLPMPYALPAWQSLPERLWLVRARDVDRQPALGLLHDLAASTDTGLYVDQGVDDADLLQQRPRFHSHSLDHPGVTFVFVSPYWTGQVDPGEQDVEISADHLAVPVEWNRGLEQLVTEAEVTWWDPIAETDESVIVTAPSVEFEKGSRRVSIRTQLVTELDAQTLAARVLLRGIPSWRTTSLVWDANLGEPAYVSGELAMMEFLKLSTRIGLAVGVTQLPAWVPSIAGAMFVEGGQLVYQADRFDRGDGNVGRWIITMDVVPAGAAGKGITWNQANTGILGSSMFWTNIDPAITWIDILAIGP